MRDPETTIKDVRHARRAAGIAAGTATGAGKTAFRAGRLWGRATGWTRRLPDARGSYLAAGGVGLAVGAAGAYFLDPQADKRRRHT